MLLRLFRVFYLLIALPLPAFAQYPDAIQVLIDDGLKVEAHFDAPGVMQGYVGLKDGHTVTLYLMNDGEHVIVGKMADGFGQNLSAEHIRNWLPKPDLAQAWQQLANATWIAEGPKDAKRIVYVFTDPNCGYCVELHKKARAYLSKGIQLRHVMVGVIQPSSLAKAASVISAEHPVEHLKFLNNQFPQDWLESSDNIPNKLRQEIEANNRLMKALSVSATPAVFYQDESNEVRKIVGLPDDIALSNAVFRSPN